MVLRSQISFKSLKLTSITSLQLTMRGSSSSLCCWSICRVLECQNRDHQVPQILKIRAGMDLRYQSGNWNCADFTEIRHFKSSFEDFELLIVHDCFLQQEVQCEWVGGGLIGCYAQVVLEWPILMLMERCPHKIDLAVFLAASIYRPHWSYIFARPSCSHSGTAKHVVVSLHRSSECNFN